jgi:beta-glucosidase
MNFDAQARALLAQMTLGEKIGQMTQPDLWAVTNLADIEKYALGSMLSGGDSDPADITAGGWLKAMRECQNHALRTRLKIPLLYGIDAVHGHNNVDGAVLFPHHVGLGATRSAALVERAERMAAREIAGTGMHWAFDPCVAVSRDIRWGRSYESFSENPELVSELGAAAIRGLQAPVKPGFSVLACAKHYLGDGATRHGIDQGDAVCDEATLRSIHLPPFIDAIKAGVGSIMVSYSSWNGVKLHRHKYLITDLLKGELGFEGFVVSDWAGIDQVSPDYQAAIELSINAGLDMVMIPNGPGKKNTYVDYIQMLKELVGAGRVSLERIDDAVARILRIKLKLGLFEHPYGAPEFVSEVGCAAHREIARECVRHSLVLLKNERGTLPFSKTLRHLAVAGAAADDLGVQCGGWTVSWQGKHGTPIQGGTTLLAAIRSRAGAETQVTWSPDGSNLHGADAVLVVVGEPPYAEGKGDRKDLALPATDAELIAKAKASGVPVVTLLYSGRPLVLGASLQQTDAFIAAWLPGTEGQGIADVLFGDCSPSGKLPRAWPANAGRLTSPENGRAATGYLFPYGYGLSYSEPVNEMDPAAKKTKAA